MIDVQINSHVKLLLRNNASVEGCVEIWAESGVQLKSLDGESLIIITSPKEDIVVTKVMLDTPETKSNPFQPIIGSLPPVSKEDEKIVDDLFARKTTNLKTRPLRQPSESEIKFKEIAKQSITPDKIKTLAELRQVMNKEEKQNFINKLRSHTPEDIKKVQYGQQSELFKKRIPE